jgi:hypothetical protein
LTITPFDAVKNVIEQAIPLISQHNYDLSFLTNKEDIKIPDLKIEDAEFDDVDLIDIKQDNVVNIDPSLSSQARLESFFRAHPANQNPVKEEQSKSYDEAINDNNPAKELNSQQYEANRPDQKPEVKEADENNEHVNRPNNRGR